MSKKSGLSFGQQLLLLIGLVLLLIGSVTTAFYFFGLSVGFPTFLIMIVIIGLIGRRYFDVTNEHYLAPLDRKLNITILFWFFVIPLFIFIVLWDTFTIGSSVILGAILGLIRATILLGIPTGLHFRKMKKLGYHLNNGKWDKEGVETDA
ncbi:hypothetical protein [Alkalihalobacillus sp. CinArs1]|uniref:hypothetical protein n=1 Tax=Alkalihalobacillus sp. CinArs1 TaxID=2995314 RepID=UPI0022DD9686|nr:hypothetical protein [Alkalihalobacillus sp. CinArs1]